MKPVIVTIDFESVLSPEAWISIAETTGIPELRRTTRDIPDYDELMQARLAILRERNISLRDLQDILQRRSPLPGAAEFLADVRKTHQVIIVSDTFMEFAKPMLEKMDDPTMFCHTLEVDGNDQITGYVLRENGTKREVVLALQQIGFAVTALGDSFNDVAMLKQADRGALIFASDTVAQQYPELPIVASYDEALGFIRDETKDA